MPCGRVQTMGELVVMAARDATTVTTSGFRSKKPSRYASASARTWASADGGADGCSAGRRHAPTGTRRHPPAKYRGRCPSMRDYTGRPRKGTGTKGLGDLGTRGLGDWARRDLL